MAFPVAGKFQDIVTMPLHFTDKCLRHNLQLLGHFEHKFSCLHLTAFPSFPADTKSLWVGL